MKFDLFCYHTNNSKSLTCRSYIVNNNTAWELRFSEIKADPANFPKLPNLPNHSKIKNPINVLKLRLLNFFSFWKTLTLHLKYFSSVWGIWCKNIRKIRQRSSKNLNCIAKIYQLIVDIAKRNKSSLEYHTFRNIGDRVLSKFCLG